MKNFWQQLEKPVFCLAPMADVTDRVFRRIIARYGKPHVIWTEFVSADGLAHPGAREKLLIDLAYTDAERPIVAQIFGARPDNIRAAAALCRDLGFDGIDLNMGCPAREIERQGAGAAHIRNPELAKLVIQAAREGAQDIPVSVKTRIGYNKNEIDSWIRELLSLRLPLLTVHLRTRKEMSKVPAHWDLMKDIVALRDRLSPETLVFGNGDAEGLEDARRKTTEFGCDGVMLGRAIFGNPWLWSGHVPALREKLSVMVEHTKLYEELLGAHKNFAIMKKHYKAYVNGFDGAKELRMRLMEAGSAAEVERITDDFLAAI